MRTLLDRQGTGEISELEADEIHENFMQNIELDFMVRQERMREEMVATYRNQTNACLQLEQPKSSFS